MKIHVSHYFPMFAVSCSLRSTQHALNSTHSCQTLKHARPTSVMSNDGDNSDCEEENSLVS